MKISLFFIVGLSLGVAPLLLGDSPTLPENDSAPESAHMKIQEKSLERMQTDRALDNKRASQAQEEFRKGTAELSVNDKQQSRKVLQLKSVETQVTAGQKQKTLAHESYKEAVQKYGSDDPRSAPAKENWKQSQEALNPLLQTRQTLKEDIHQGSRLVHNEKTVLSVQKRDIDTDARYRAIGDRKIQKKEKTIEDEQNATSQNESARLPEPASSPK